MNEKERKRVKTSATPGLSIIGCFLTGVAGWIHAFSTGEPLGLFASAVSFGVVVVVSFR